MRTQHILLNIKLDYSKFEIILLRLSECKYCSSYAVFYTSEVDRLKTEIESRCEDAEQLKQLQDVCLLLFSRLALYVFVCESV